ncbi:MAG: RNA 2',3'-cyclic phosphodiesterase [Actinomycetota bacterium]
MAGDRASRPEAKPVRLFVAVDVPESLRDDVAARIAPLRERVRGKWVPTQNWHLTLKFLGATWPRVVDWVKASCEGVARSRDAFETSLTGLGTFPNERRARVLWVGLDDPAGRLASIVSGLDDALSSEFKVEKRPFTAHLTVARFDPTVSLAGELEGIEVSGERFSIDKLVLYRSHLQRPAPRYEQIGEFPLGR